MNWCPRISYTPVFGAGATIVPLSLAQQLWSPEEGPVAGMEATSASGLIMGFFTRYDYACGVTLRFTDAEYDSVMDFIEWALRNKRKSFLWRFDQNVESSEFLAYLESPKVGDRVKPQRNTNAPWTWTLDLMLRSADSTRVFAKISEGLVSVTPIPVNLATTYHGLTRIVFGWTDTTFGNGTHEIERNGVVIDTVALGVASYSDYELTSDVEYTYRVRAVVAFSESEWSDALVVTTKTLDQVPNYQLWLDARDDATITEVGGAISAWADKGGNGRTPGQGTAASRPVKAAAAINGNQAVRFDDVNDYLTLAWPAGAQLNTGSTIFVLVNPAYIPGAGRNYPLVRWTPSNAAGMQCESTTDANVPSRGRLEAFVGTNAGLKRATPVAVVANVAQLKTQVTSMTQISIYRDDVLEAGPIGGYVSITTSVGDTFNISKDEGVQRAGQDIGVIFVVSRALADLEREDIAYHIMSEWGLV